MPALPPSIREQIIAAVIAALKAAATPDGESAPAGLTIHRERTRPIEVDSLPAILVYFEDDTVKPFDGQRYRSPLVKRDLQIALQCRAEGSATASPDQALDSILTWALKAGFADETFGGLALGAAELRTDWKSREGDAPVAAATLHMSLEYRTSRLDPTSSNA